MRLNSGTNYALNHFLHVCSVCTVQRLLCFSVALKVSIDTDRTSRCLSPSSLLNPVHSLSILPTHEKKVKRQMIVAGKQICLFFKYKIAYPMSRLFYNDDRTRLKCLA